MIPAEPLLRYPAPDDVRARLTTRLRLRSRSGALPRKKTPPRAGLKYWDERTQRVVEFVPPAPMPNLARGSGLSIKNFGGRSPARDRMKSRQQRGSLFRSSPRGATPRRSRRGDPRCGDPAWPWIPAGVHPRESGGGNERSLSGGRSKVDTSRTARNVAPAALFCYFVGSRDELKPSFSFGPVNH